MPTLRTNDVGALQQELLDMQRRLNSAQLDLETERARNRMSVVQTRHLESQLADLRRLNSEQERMLKNRQVEYELLEGEVKVLADSAAASAASAAQAKAYKALVVPGYPVRFPAVIPPFVIHLRCRIPRLVLRIWRVYWRAMR